MCPTLMGHCIPCRNLPACNASPARKLFQPCRKANTNSICPTSMGHCIPCRELPACDSRPEQGTTRGSCCSPVESKHKQHMPHLIRPLLSLQESTCTQCKSRTGHCKGDLSSHVGCGSWDQCMALAWCGRPASCWLFSGSRQPPWSPHGTSYDTSCVIM